MPFPWTKSFSAPSNLGLPKRGLDLELKRIIEFNNALEHWYWNVFAVSQIKMLEQQSYPVRRLNNELVGKRKRKSK